MHASDWNPPARYEAAFGPVFASTRRDGPLTDCTEVPDVSIPYRFYSRVPWIHMSSKIEVKKDIAVQALRNGEVVLNRDLADESAWRRAGGGADNMVITGRPAPTRARQGAAPRYSLGLLFQPPEPLRPGPDQLQAGQFPFGWRAGEAVQALLIFTVGAQGLLRPAPALYLRHQQSGTVRQGQGGQHLVLCPPSMTSQRYADIIG